MRPRALPGTAVLRRGGTVFAGLVGWNAGNYAFFLLAGRILGPSDYGLVAALLAGTLVIAVPAQSLQFAAARLVAAPPGGDAALAEAIYRRAWRRCALATPVLALSVCAVILAVDVPSTGPLLATVGLVVPLGFFFLALGHLQGEERFGAFSLCFTLWGVPRPIALVPLAALGLGVYAALGATGVAVLSALAAAMWLTRSGPVTREPTRAEWRSFARPLLPLVVGLSGLGVLVNLDVIVARLGLSADAAGQFAASATLAKSTLLVPQVVSLVVLPRVARRSAAAEDTGMLVGLGVGLTLVAGGVASVVLWAAAEPLLRITYGSEFTGSANTLGAYAAASTLIGALIVLINHHVGRGADGFVWVTAAVATFQALLFVGMHGSASAIIAVDAIAGLVGLVLHECLFFRSGDGVIPGLRRALRLLGANRPAPT